jgi:DNA primase
MAEQVKVDFKHLKSSVPLAVALEHYGVAFKPVNQTYLRANCPLPSHTSKESKSSFAVNVEKNIWCCKSTSCNAIAKKKGGDVLDFVTLMEGCSVLDAAKKLLEWFPQNGASSKRLTQEPNVNKSGPKATNGELSKTLTVLQENKPLGFELKGITYHPYLESRGISKELAEKFGIGFFPGKGSMSGRIVIPIRDHRGQLVAYAGRSVNGEEPKYKVPAGFHKGLVLFNRHSLKGEAVTITESFFGTMKVVEAGFPCVGLMGCTLSEAQERLLCFKFVTLMLDPDEAGRTATLELLPRLARNHYVRIARNEKAPDEMTTEEIRNALRYVCPIPGP